MNVLQLDSIVISRLINHRLHSISGILITVTGCGDDVVHGKLGVVCVIILMVSNLLQKYEVSEFLIF